MSHKFLKKIGVKPFFRKFPTRWHLIKEKIIYGFDSRETYSLDMTFMCWLYERLKMYVQCAQDTVDLEWHKFTWKDKEYTQLELISVMLSRLERFLKDEIDWSDSMEAYNYIKEIGEIWAIVLPAMWW